jgi:ParB/RepB/Spo0J family partition protein
MGADKIAKLQAGLTRQREQAAPRIIPTPVHDRHHGRYALPGAFMIERRYLIPDPEQPRKHFDEEKLSELAQSITEHGILQPLRVRPAPDYEDPGYYYIVAGERRWRAAGLADCNELPAIVRDSEADRRSFEQLVENLQREDLSDQDEANAYARLRQQGYGVRQIAEKLGVSPARVSKDYRLFEDDALADPVIRGELTKSQAQELLIAPMEVRAPLVRALTEASREAGPPPRALVREVARGAREALQQGRTVAEVMESVSLRNSAERPTVTVATHERSAPLSRADRDLLALRDKLRHFSRQSLGTRPSAFVKAELLQAIGEFAAWLEDRS